MAFKRYCEDQDGVKGAYAWKGECLTLLHPGHEAKASGLFSAAEALKIERKVAADVKQLKKAAAVAEAVEEAGYQYNRFSSRRFLLNPVLYPASTLQHD